MLSKIFAERLLYNLILLLFLNCNPCLTKCVRIVQVSIWDFHCEGNALKLKWKYEHFISCVFIPQIKPKSVLHIYHQNIFFTIIDCNIFVSEQQVTELQVAEYRIMFQSTHYYHHHMSPVPANCPHLEG